MNKFLKELDKPQNIFRKIEDKMTPAGEEMQDDGQVNRR